ncbi:MAG TPA: hypothetical protein VF875_02725 [Anaeromyxobacter sp.]
MDRLLLLDRSDREPGDPSILDGTLRGLGRRPPRIRCPLCRWQPVKSSRWYCSHCGARWNTFETGGVCPGCTHRWLVTACLSCQRYSRHADWYERGEGAPGA